MICSRVVRQTVLKSFEMDKAATSRCMRLWDTSILQKVQSNLFNSLTNHITTNTVTFSRFIKAINTKRKNEEQSFAVVYRFTSSSSAVLIGMKWSQS